MIRQGYTSEFEAFWQAYPRRISKKSAFKSFEKAMRDGVTLEKILLALKAYTAWLTDGNGWRPEPKHPSTWLNQGCWDDEYEPPQREKEKISFKIPDDILQKLRSTGLQDQIIKRWFDDAIFVDGGHGIVFPTFFMRAHVSTHYDGNLHRAFGFMPELGVSPAAVLRSG